SWLILHWTDFALALELGPILQVQLHEFPRVLERLGVRFQLHHGVAADHFLRLSEWTVGDGDLASSQLDPVGVSGGFQAIGINQDPALETRLDELAHRFVEPGRYWLAAVVLGVLDEHQVAHGNLLLPACRTGPEEFDSPAPGGPRRQAY